MCACVSQTRPETTRVDILFEGKHNKTHWNMVQEEQAVILKVNKQKRRVVEVLSLLSSQHREGVGGGWSWAYKEEGNVGFSNLSGSDGFPPAVCLTNASSLWVSIAVQHLAVLICGVLGWLTNATHVYTWNQLRLKPRIHPWIGVQGHDTWNLTQHLFSKAHAGFVFPRGNFQTTLSCKKRKKTWAQLKSSPEEEKKL